jgi:osmotically-inducible protein OsmY
MTTQAGKGPRGWTRDDTRLIEDVSERLMQDRLLDAREIQVSADDGRITLTGHVPRAADIALAVMLARQTAGVADVVNNLTHLPGPSRADPPQVPQEGPHYEGAWGRWLPPVVT